MASDQSDSGYDPDDNVDWEALQARVQHEIDTADDLDD